jgi:hypothetical protein
LFLIFLGGGVPFLDRKKDNLEDNSVKKFDFDHFWCYKSSKTA